MPLRLRTWTRTLGYRGHILIKPRAYSTTYAALRAIAPTASATPTLPTRSRMRTGATSAPATPPAPPSLPLASLRTWRRIRRKHVASGASMTGEPVQPLPEWISEILCRWVPPKDFDTRMTAVIDSYLADRVKPETPASPHALRRPA
ncbi:hypothetical protein [Streptomyces tendae]|uniref:hypothetical protein n=1 Tax=Streptomyces tendae TaxID=1932 RepID=UPI002E2D5183|nr:hypothetical protein [Streptomyces tendae]